MSDNRPRRGPMPSPKRMEGVRLYGEGKTIDEVAAQLKVHRSRVHQWLVASKTQRRPRGTPKAANPSVQQAA